MNGVNTQTHLSRVLSLVRQQRDNVDLLVLTGDLCHEPTPQNYDRLFATLDDVNIPFIAIPGNHDVTLELDNLYLCPAPSFASQSRYSPAKML